MGMPLAPLQESVDAWIRDHGGYWDEMSLFARLVEEVGEVSREYNHSFGAKKKKPGCEGGGISDELGDLLFILICMANQQGIDLDDALAQSLKKYDIRDATRWA